MGALDGGKVSFSLLSVPVLSAHASPNGKPPDRTEGDMTISVGLLKPEIGAGIPVCLHSHAVIPPRCCIPPPQPAAKRQPFFKVVSGFGPRLDQLVVLERVKA